jgi:hypothetical protein
MDPAGSAVDSRRLADDFEAAPRGFLNPFAR